MTTKTRKEEFLERIAGLLIIPPDGTQPIPISIEIFHDYTNKAPFTPIPDDGTAPPTPTTASPVHLYFVIIRDDNINELEDVNVKVNVFKSDGTAVQQELKANIAKGQRSIIVSMEFSAPDENTEVSSLCKVGDRKKVAHSFKTKK